MSKILVIEDEATIRRVLIKILTEENDAYQYRGAVPLQSRETHGHRSGQDAQGHFEAVQRRQRDEVEGGEKEVPEDDGPHDVADQVVRRATEQ